MQQSGVNPRSLMGKGVQFWASLLAPAGISLLVIGGTSIAVLAMDPDEVNRSSVSRMNFASRDFEEPRTATLALGDDEEPRVERPPPPRERTSRRRGFSPVLGAEPSPEQTEEPAPEEPLDEEDFDEDGRPREPRGPITAERRVELLKKVADGAENFAPFRPFKERLQRYSDRESARLRGEEVEEGIAPEGASENAASNAAMGGAAATSELPED